MIPAAAPAARSRGKGGRGRSPGRHRERRGKPARLAEEPEDRNGRALISDDQYAAGERLRAD